MKTQLIDNIISEKELFYMYQKIISMNSWRITGTPGDLGYPTNKQFLTLPQLVIIDNQENICNYPLYMYGQTLVYRIIEKLKNKNTSIHSKLDRMWFNITYSGEETQHFLHQDWKSDEKQSIVMFMTPIWSPNWKGSFYVDSEEFKFKPGNAVIFDSNNFHTGESPESKTQNWLRLTLSMLVSK